MKIKIIETTYLISLPFNYDSKKGIVFGLILEGNVLISGIKKDDLKLIRIVTTRGDSIFTPKNIRLTVDSRYLKEDKLKNIIEKIISEVKILFTKDNIHLTNKILSEHVVIL